jgi:hypothetical protein
MRQQVSFLRLRAVFFVLLMMTARAGYTEKSTSAWQRWEHTLTSTRSYEQPYKQVSLLVEYTGPGGESFTSYGFWEEGNIFKIRTAFPNEGKWQWRTSCSDKTNEGLHDRSGEVNVDPYEGNNSLYKNGFLKVGRDKRTLAHANDKPFLWMGDTGWYVLRESTPGEWKKYIDNRARKEFTIIQAHVANSFATAPNVNGEFPFENDIPNRSFWTDLETKIEYANQQGLIVYVVGLGVSGKGGYHPGMNTKEFARYITGRLAGNFVILSPSMDAHYDKRNDELGNYLKNTDTRHLISQHVGTDLSAAEIYHEREYLDFTSLQSGHHAGNINKAYAAARDWSYLLWRKQPVKPVINSEGMYDGLGNDNGVHWREIDVRRVGWLSWLSGALGYTYGAGNNKNKVTGSNGGVWLFNKDSETYDFWEKALDWNSASQMTFMKQFFAGIHWWNLRPAPEMITNQPEEPVNMMTTARSSAGDLLVAYLPDNPYIELDMEELNRGLSAQWFNPVTGKYLPIDEKIKHSGRQKFSRPGEGDWLLTIQTRKKAGQKKNKN